MDENALAGVRAIAARNDALARENLGLLLAALEAQQARNGGHKNSRRWHAIVQLLEEEGRKLIRATNDDVRKLDATSAAFPILEAAFRDFMSMMEERYFALGSKAAPFGGSRPIADQENNPFSDHWWQAKNRLELEIEAGRAGFKPSSATLPASNGRGQRNPGGKPLAQHWNDMWADIAVQLWNGDLNPKRQADISNAMFAWFNGKEIDVGQTAVTDRARTLWSRIEPLL